ncbi:MAG: endopeptidase La [Gammaproteobacteria bacterium]|nr:endopeptidase La [Gammaproteobacteria bacterium]MYK82396.1 endopeptidase La [Gammaproteobacteria bacterium]
MKVVKTIPVLPLRAMVVYPHGVQPLLVGTERSIKAIETAMSGDQQVLLVAKREAGSEPAEASDLFEVGTLATVLQSLKSPPGGTVKILVEGQARARIEKHDFTGTYITAAAVPLADAELEEEQAETLRREALSQFERYAQDNRKVPQEVMASLSSLTDASRLLDAVAAQIDVPAERKQEVLEELDLGKRGELLMSLMAGQLGQSEMDKAIRGRVNKQMEKSQREYYLNEQMKAIQKELGKIQESPDEFETLAKSIEEARLPKEAKEKALAELGKLRQMPPMSAESTVVRTYIDWMVRIPWQKRSRLARDMARAERVLNEDHYGLDEVKERVLECLAVQVRTKRTAGPILCLVGPPGVGKTSLGESIARATGRRFARMALGGVRDEAEIRGHRRTYIGSLPGKVLQKMAKVGVRNPLFLLDEVDKLGMDYRGDPASALLEVLDPEQNSRFNDHYLEVDYDLSDVFFICTSNSLDIPAPLLDRMEVIRLPGYMEEEKLNIARRFLLPKQMAAAGLAPGELAVDDDALIHLIRHYTREAGVRGLERELAKLARKVVREKVVSGDGDGTAIGATDLERYNGVRKFTYGLAEEQSRVGVATGLAWTEAGGELLNIEAVAVPGKGRQTRTGSLGDVMQESIQAALTFVRSRSESLGVPGDFHQKYDLHVHVPEGATPKDGPSAGIGMCAALVSVATGVPVKASVAMTGEITLRGRLLRIGGLKEKLLAAHRGGIREVIIPAENERDLKEIPDGVKSGLNIHPVQWMDQVLDLALESHSVSALPLTSEAMPPVAVPAEPDLPAGPH